jgi:N-acetylmuramoyl-L-alanine amidase
LFEYEFNRDIVKRIHDKLSKLNIDSHILVPEDLDIGLTKRARRANSIYIEHPDAFLISVHANAGGGTG